MAFEVAEEIRQQMLGATIQVMFLIAKQDASSRQEVELARGGKVGKPTFDALDEKNALLLEKPLPVVGIQAPIQPQADPNVGAVLQLMQQREAREHAEVNEMKAEMAELRSMLEAATALASKQRVMADVDEVRIRAAAFDDALRKQPEQKNTPVPAQKAK